MCSPTKHINLSSVCRLLKLDESNVLALYVYGSRLWGSADATSDWDFVIIKRSNDGKSSGEKVGNTHIDNIDAAIYEEVKSACTRQLATLTIADTCVRVWRACVRAGRTIFVK